MGSSCKFFPAVAILLLLVVATEVAPIQANECKTTSTKFKGLCFMSTNCAHICISEGFSGGECEGLSRRCMCNTSC
ncbi:hypothetical protein ACQ4PT_011924 [Festuca glaucescens]